MKITEVTSGALAEALHRIDQIRSIEVMNGGLDYDDQARLEHYLRKADKLRRQTTGSATLAGKQEGRRA